MTVTPQEVDYALPTNVDTTAPLTNPSHSDLHNGTNRAVLDLNGRVSNLERLLSDLTAPNGSVDQARLAAHEWVVRGPISADGSILMPLIWNMTGRSVTFQAAIATVLNPSDADIEVDIVIGSVLSGPVFDPDTQTSILKAGKLVVPANQHLSVDLGVDDFGTEQAVGTYITAYVESVGAGGTGSVPGEDLTIQLNRNL